MEALEAASHGCALRHSRRRRDVETRLCSHAESRYAAGGPRWHALLACWRAYNVESLLPVTVPAAFTTVTTPVVALVVVIVWLVVFLLVFLLIRGLATTFLSIPVSTTGETGVGTMPRKRRGRSSWCSPRAGAAVLVHFVSLNLVFQVLLQLYVFRAEAGMSQHGSSCVLDSKFIAKSATFKKWGVQLTQFSPTWTPFL